MSDHFVGDPDPGAAPRVDRPPTETPAGEPVFGELMVGEAILPSPEQEAASRSRAISRTDSQAFQGMFVVTVLVWILRLNDIDLNPDGEGTGIPADVAVAMAAIVTALAGRWMNRKPKG